MRSSRQGSDGDRSPGATAAGADDTHHHGRARRIAFLVSVVLVSLFLLLALLPAYPLIVVNWLPHDLWLAVRTDHGPGDVVHRLHSLALAVIAWGMLLGIVVQVHGPRDKQAPLLAALAVPISIAAGELLTGTYTVMGTAPFIGLILVVAVLHPAARELFSPPRWNLPMLGLTAVAAVPWIGYAVSIGEAAQSDVPEWDVEHMTFMSTLGLLAVLWGIIGAADRRGWQFAAGAAVVAAGSIGLQSVLFPKALSGLTGPWAVATLGWCLVYAGAAAMRLIPRRTNSS